MAAMDALSLFMLCILAGMCGSDKAQQRPVFISNGSSCDITEFLDEDSLSNYDEGPNVMFLVHSAEDINPTEWRIIQALVTKVVTHVKTSAVYYDGNDSYSLGLTTFSDSAEINFFLGQCSAASRSGRHADEFLEVFQNITLRGKGCRIAEALQVTTRQFGVTTGHRILSPNLCILITTSSPDNRTEAETEAKNLRDSGVSVLIVVVGDGVATEEVDDLGSSHNALFSANGKLQNGTVIEIASSAADDIITSLKTARFLPRFSLCYQGFINLTIIIDISEDHIRMLSQIRDFIIQFNLQYLSVKAIIINSPLANKKYMEVYISIASTRGLQFETYGMQDNLLSRLKVIRKTYSHRDLKEQFHERILMVVSDKYYEDIDDIVQETRLFKESRIHIMGVVVGKKIEESQLSELVSDQMGLVSIGTVRDLKSGLDDLNRKLCPAVCDVDWIYHDNMCYFHGTIVKRWLEAKAECEKYNSKLVSITNLEKMEWLHRSFIDNSTGGNIFPLHIGLRIHVLPNKTISSDWRWANGKPLIFSVWSKEGDVPQPDGAKHETCGTWGQNGWLDESCLLLGRYICEREAGNATKTEAEGIEVAPLWEQTVCPLDNSSGHKILSSGTDCRPVLDVFTSSVSMNHFYNCTNGELISIHLLCDGVQHCKDASDEVNCSKECKESQFQCNNGRCVSLAYFCDFWDDCGDNSDETYCVYSVCPDGTWQCHSGQCVDDEADCDLYYDCYDKSDEMQCAYRCRQDMCSDGTCIPKHWFLDGFVDCGGNDEDDEKTSGSHTLEYTGKYRELIYLFIREKYLDERPKCSMVFDGFGKFKDSYYNDANCNESVICPIGFERCPSSYCIPLDRICDGIMDCVHGEDEMNCDDYICPGYFRCPGASYCLHPSRLCDGEVDCPGGKDEVMCDETCPENCTCVSGHVECRHFTSTDSSPFDHNTRSLILIKSLLAYPKFAFKGLHYLREAKLSGLSLLNVGGIFRSQANLKLLDLSNNNITHISPYSLTILGKLDRMDISFNSLSSFTPKSFEGLKSLKQLNMSYSNIEILEKESFICLSKLEILDLRGSFIRQIEDGAFSGLEALRILYMQGNDIILFHEFVYDGLLNIKEVHTDMFSLCCPHVRPGTVDKGKCVAPELSISTCDDMLGNDILRASIWILCIAAIVGNIFAISMRLCWDRRTLKCGYGVFVIHLSISDFMMGIYLLVIAIADTKFQGKYVWMDYDWRQTVHCKIAGFLSTLSSEASTLFICLITIDRFLVIKFPFGQVRFRYKSATALSVIAWVIAVAIAGVPLLPSLSHWEFYSRNEVCLALPFSTERKPGWIYSTAIFTGLNFVAFIFIGIGQYFIYRSVKSGSLITSKARSVQDMAIARRLLLVVVTDFLCWFPVGVLSVVALSGKTVGDDVYAWTAVFVLPVNSALNPFLYTIPAVLQKLKRDNERKSSMLTAEGSLATLSKKISVTIGEPENDQILLEDLLLQLKVEEKMKLLQCITFILVEHKCSVPSDEVRNGAIFVALKGKAVDSICLSRKDRKCCEVSRFLLSIPRRLGVFVESMEES